jgi:hypothetical protein
VAHYLAALCNEGRDLKNKTSDVGWITAHQDLICAEWARMNNPKKRTP